MTNRLEISPAAITLDQIFKYFETDFEINLGPLTIQAIEKNRSFLKKQLEDSSKLIYGINTGFGSLCNVAITHAQIEDLQYNLIVSHACGQGNTVPEKIARLILLLKIKNMSMGYSGVRKELVLKMIQLYNHKLTPTVYQQGSLGASGDLAPLAHMSLPLIGEGELWYKGEIRQSKEVLNELGIEPITLKAKEGLALINGTQFSLAYSLWSTYHAQRIIRWSNVIASMSIQAFVCSLDPFDPDLHRIRQQEGQKLVAKEVLELCKDSDVLNQHLHSVQDPYSFRCVPQVHGATLDTINYVSTIVQRELNAVTDNPNVFDSEGKILSGGNFHAQPLALALDFLGIAVSELGSISERRTYKLINGERGLPDYLTKHPGLHSGFMIPQYTAASIVSQNKQLCTPASVDSIVSSKGQEDHVSMAANSATKMYKIINNLYKLLSIELMVAAQALDLRKDKSSPQTAKLLSDYRKRVPMLDTDRIMKNDIDKGIEFIKNNVY